MNKEELEQKDFTIKTKKSSIKREWIIIGGIKKWIRKCPLCKKKLYNVQKSHFIWNKKHNTVCMSCKNKSHIGLKYKKKPIDHIKLLRMCPRCNTKILYKSIGRKNEAERNNRVCYSCKGIKTGLKLKNRTITNETKLKIGNKNRGRKISEEHKKKISKYFKGRISPLRGIKHTEEQNKKVSKALLGIKRSDEFKRKMRLAAIKRISRQKFDGGQMYPSFNRIACKFIDKYGKQNGYNFQHAMNGGEFYIKELGYWVDGYDKKKNVIFEYDEEHHIDKLTENLKKKDIQRMNEIKEHLKCKFIRYNERTHEIKEY